MGRFHPTAHSREPAPRAAMSIQLSMYKIESPKCAENKNTGNQETIAGRSINKMRGHHRHHLQVCFKPVGRRHGVYSIDPSSLHRQAPSPSLQPRRRVVPSPSLAGSHKTGANFTGSMSPWPISPQAETVPAGRPGRSTGRAAVSTTEAPLTSPAG